MAAIKEMSLYSIFSESNYFEIPIYQRNYIWNEVDCIRFFNDIYNNYIYNKIRIKSEAIKYYVGNAIIFCPDYSQQIIVDGQQRLTTTMLIYCALRDFACSKDAELEVWCENNIQRLLSFCQISSNKSFKLKLNNLKNMNELQNIIEKRNPSNSKNIYYKNYLAIKAQIHENHKTNENVIEDTFNSLINTILVTINIKEYDDPNKLFEVINTTGKKLSFVDLIKNFIFFNSIQYKEKISELSNAYDAIEKHFILDEKTENLEKNMIGFFRYLVPILSDQHKFKLQAENSIEIYYDFKKLFNDEHIFCVNNMHTYEGVKNVISVIAKHSKIWELIHTYDPKTKKDKYYYQTFLSSKKTYYSLVHQYIFHYIEDDFSKFTSQMKKIMKIVCQLSFSLLFLSKAEKNITRDVPNLFINYLSFSKNNNKTFEAWLTEDNENLKLLNKAQINEYINSTSVYKISENKCKWLLIGIEMVCANWEISIEESEISIEHILPQKVEDNSSYRKVSLKLNDNEINKAKTWEAKVKDTLPNLTIVAKKLNSSLGNMDFNDKKAKMYESTNLIINKKISEYFDWDEISMLKRSEWLTDKIAQLLNL